MSTKGKVLLFVFLGVIVFMVLALVVFPLSTGTLYEDGSHSTLGCIMPWMGCTPTLGEFLVVVGVAFYFGFMIGGMAMYAHMEV